jgi:hypothetical protein
VAEPPFVPTRMPLRALRLFNLLGQGLPPDPGWTSDDLRQAADRADCEEFVRALRRRGEHYVETPDGEGPGRGEVLAVAFAVAEVETVASPAFARRVLELLRGAAGVLYAIRAAARELGPGHFQSRTWDWRRWLAVRRRYWEQERADADRQLRALRGRAGLPPLA